MGGKGTNQFHAKPNPNQTLSRIPIEMAFRGRGRGRGFGRGGNDFRHARQEPFVLFPDIELPDRRNIPRDDEVIRYNVKLRRYFRNSPYCLEETLTDEPESMDIERYSDRAKRATRFGRGSLLSSGFLMLQPGYFPVELVQGTKRRVGRKVNWNPKQDLQKLDILEQLEEKRKGQDTSVDEKENDEDEEDEENPEEEEEDSDEGDYDKNMDFDDDEDDYNVIENVDPDDEHIF